MGLKAHAPSGVTENGAGIRFETNSSCPIESQVNRKSPTNEHHRKLVLQSTIRPPPPTIQLRRPPLQIPINQNPKTNQPPAIRIPHLKQKYLRSLQRMQVPPKSLDIPAALSPTCK